MNLQSILLILKFSEAKGSEGRDSLGVMFAKDSTWSADQVEPMPKNVLVYLERPYGFWRYVEVHISLFN